MKKIMAKPVLTLAFLAGALGVSSVPMSASAHSGYWNNNSWSRWDNDNNRWRHHGRAISHWEARNIAQRLFPHKHIVRDDDRRGHDGRHEHRFRFDDNHCVDVREDGVVVRIFIIIDR